MPFGCRFAKNNLCYELHLRPILKVETNQNLQENLVNSIRIIQKFRWNDGNGPKEVNRGERQRDRERIMKEHGEYEQIRNAAADKEYLMLNLWSATCKLLPSRFLCTQTVRVSVCVCTFRLMPLQQKEFLYLIIAFYIIFTSVRLLYFPVRAYFLSLFTEELRIYFNRKATKTF